MKRPYAEAIAGDLLPPTDLLQKSYPSHSVSTVNVATGNQNNCRVVTL